MRVGGDCARHETEPAVEDGTGLKRSRLWTGSVSKRDAERGQLAIRRLRERNGTCQGALANGTSGWGDGATSFLGGSGDAYSHVGGLVAGPGVRGGVRARQRLR